MKKKSVNIIIALLGIILFLIVVSIISNDKVPKLYGTYYTYESPLTSHEITMIVLLIVSGLVAGEGIANLIIIYVTEAKQKLLGNNDPTNSAQRTAGSSSTNPSVTYSENASPPDSSPSEESIICQNCGKRNTNQSKFCIYCGHHLE